MKRPRESHVSERDENIVRMEEFHKAANNHQQFIDECESKIKLLENEYDYFVSQYKRLALLPRTSYSREKLRKNSGHRQEILDMQMELIQHMGQSEIDQQWNLDQADNILNILNGYADSPAAFVGLGTFMDDEPALVADSDNNEMEYGVPLSQAALAHLSTYSHSGNPTTHQAWPANPFNN